MLVLGLTGLVFGIVLIVSANSIHNETAKELAADGRTADIGQLRSDRENVTAKRRAFFAPFGPAAYNPYDDTQQPGFNYLIMEKGLGVSLTSLSRAMMYQYAGIGILVLGIGLAVGGVVQYRMAGRMT